MQNKMLTGIIIALVLVGAVSVAFVKMYPSKEVMNEDTVEVKLTAADNGSEFELKKGQIMVYHRPWETDVEPLKTFAVHVVVVDTSK
jgi:hypothetical protein